MDSRKTGLLINIAYYGIIGLGAFLALRYLFPVLFPFAAAFLISAALRRPIHILSVRFTRIPRKVIAFSVLAVFYALAGLSFSLLFRALAVQLLEFISTLPSALGQLADSLLSVRDRIVEVLPDWLSTPIDGSAEQLLLSAVDALSDPLIELLATAGSAAIKLPSIVFVLFVTIICSFFITLDYDGARKTLVSIFPAHARSILSHTRRRAAQAVKHLLRTYGTLMLITFGELCFGFWILNLLGAEIKYVFALSLVISLVDILPVLGVGTVLIPWALASLVSGNSRLCIMLLALCGVMYIVRNTLESRLVGHRFGLHPALTLLALYVGGKWFGILGIFLLPLTLIVAMQLRRDGVFDQRTSDTVSVP